MTQPKRATLTLDETLVLLMEECAEVAQAASKCLRFGYDTKGPDHYGINRKVLASEIGDLLGVVDALPDIEQYLVTTGRNRKMRKAEEAKAKFGVTE
jgi:NTP pyrophosphatase (non-canonical NTP hydrolase)